MSLSACEEACEELNDLIYDIDCDRTSSGKPKVGDKDLYRLEWIKVDTKTSRTGIHEVKYSFTVYHLIISQLLTTAFKY